MNDVETTWSVMKDFISDHTATAIYADSFLNTHQISMKVRNTLEINQLFDSITYDKGLLQKKAFQKHIFHDLCL